MCPHTHFSFSCSTSAFSPERILTQDGIPSSFACFPVSRPHAGGVVHHQFMDRDKAHSETRRSSRRSAARGSRGQPAHGVAEWSWQPPEPTMRSQFIVAVQREEIEHRFQHLSHNPSPQTGSPAPGCSVFHSLNLHPTVSLIDSTLSPFLVPALQNPDVSNAWRAAACAAAKMAQPPQRLPPRRQNLSAQTMAKPAALGGQDGESAAT